MTKAKGSKINSDYMNDFNADSDEDLEKTEQAAGENFGALFDQSMSSQPKKLKVGDKIVGKILNVGSQEVFVTTGTMHDGVLQRVELLDAQGKLEFQAGDMLNVYVTMVKGDEIRLSRKTSDRQVAGDIKEAFENNRPIQGRIVEVCKGGVRVSIKGKLAFCPISQIDSLHVTTPEEYVGKSFEFKITEFSEGGRNIVVSRRKLLDAERDIGAAHFLSEKKDGDLATGRVTRMEPFGAFVELAPGVEGLVHISEISWSRIGTPSEVLVAGQTVTVKLLKREVLNGKTKISLSIKQVTPKEEKESEAQAPKEDKFGKYAVGQTFTGKVSRKEAYGLFVQLEQGVTGLLHKSRLEGNNSFQFEKVRVNDSIEVQIVEIKGAERQIALSLPGDASENDWKKDYKPAASSSLGTLASQMSAALSKRK